MCTIPIGRTDGSAYKAVEQLVPAEALRPRRTVLAELGPRPGDIASCRWSEMGQPGHSVRHWMATRRSASNTRGAPAGLRLMTTRAMNIRSSSRRSSSVIAGHAARTSPMSTWARGAGMAASSARNFRSR